jgi:hypothetical protein
VAQEHADPWTLFCSLEKAVPCAALVRNFVEKHSSIENEVLPRWPQFDTYSFMMRLKPLTEDDRFSILDTLLTERRQCDDSAAARQDMYASFISLFSLFSTLCTSSSHLRKGFTSFEAAVQKAPVEGRVNETLQEATSRITALEGVELQARVGSPAALHSDYMAVCLQRVIVGDLATSSSHLPAALSLIIECLKKERAAGSTAGLISSALR